MNVRPPQSVDVVADDLPPPRPDCDEPAWLRTVVAERGGRVVGSASVLLTRVHDAYFCDVEVSGCELVMHCPEPWADPTAPAWRRWAADHPVPAGYSAVPMSDLPPAAVEAAWRTYYIWVHVPFAPV